jgi:hypothetical protein
MIDPYPSRNVITFKMDVDSGRHLASGGIRHQGLPLRNDILPLPLVFLLADKVFFFQQSELARFTSMSSDGGWGEQVGGRLCKFLRISFGALVRKFEQF